MNKRFLVCLAVVLCFIVVGCGKKDDKDPIVGTWTYGTGSSFEYVFNEDKTCSYVGRNCTYTIEGDKLSILYEGDTAPFETTFKIEGNKLTIKDSFDNDVVYTKK